MRVLVVMKMCPLGTHLQMRESTARPSASVSSLLRREAGKSLRPNGLGSWKVISLPLTFFSSRTARALSLSRVVSGVMRSLLSDVPESVPQVASRPVAFPRMGPPAGVRSRTGLGVQECLEHAPGNLSCVATVWACHCARLKSWHGD